MLTRVTRALVLEPHPDDLAIGCGGLVRRLVDEGTEVHGLLMSEVPQKYTKIYEQGGGYTPYSGEDRMREAVAADEILGVAGRTIAFGPEWHHKLDAMPSSELIGAIEECVARARPELVLVPARSYNQDHRAVFDAFQAVMRPHFYRGMVLAYETTMERDFEPDVVVSLTERQLGRKLEGCRAYQTQLGTSEHLFSVDTIELAARYRGRLAYTAAAEAFQMIRGTWL
jgi:LmbE family N-acetylglucosaminyl deacetylase